jgi:hypothetical protein
MRSSPLGKGRCEFSPPPDFDRVILTEFVQAILQAGQCGQIGRLDVGEVRARAVAFDKSKFAERLSPHPPGTVVEGKFGEMMEGQGRRTGVHFLFVFPLFQSDAVDRVLGFDRDRIVLRIADLLDPPFPHSFFVFDINPLKLIQIVPPIRRGAFHGGITQMEHEVGGALGGQRIERVARVTRQNEIRLIGQDTGVADDPRNGIRNQARPGSQAAEGEEGASVHESAGSMERRAWSRKGFVCHNRPRAGVGCVSVD